MLAFRLLVFHVVQSEKEILGLLKSHFSRFSKSLTALEQLMRSPFAYIHNLNFISKFNGFVFLPQSYAFICAMKDCKTIKVSSDLFAILWFWIRKSEWYSLKPFLVDLLIFATWEAKCQLNLTLDFKFEWEIIPMFA